MMLSIFHEKFLQCMDVIMLFRKFFCCFFCLSICLVFAHANASSWQPQSMVIFGDGTSDNGLTYKNYGIPVSPPYWHHRFSNGPVGVEYLGHLLHIIKQDPIEDPNYSRNNFMDYSIIGAVFSSDYATQNRYSITISNEIDSYAQNHNAPLRQYTLVVIFLYGVLDINTRTCLENPLSCIQSSMNGMTNDINRLYSMGLKHFLIITPAGYDSSFGLNLVFKGDKKILQSFALAKQNVVAQYYHAVAMLRAAHPDAKFVLFNFYDFAKQDSMNFASTNGRVCYVNVVNGKDIYSRQVGPVCSYPNSYYYFDAFHPSTIVWRATAHAIYKQLQQQTTWTSARKSSWWSRIFK